MAQKLNSRIPLASGCEVARPEGHWAKEAYQIYDMNTALHMAAAMGHTDICALLLIHGPAAANKANRMGATALHMAAKGTGAIFAVDAGNVRILSTVVHFLCFCLVLVCFRCDSL
eukprot:g20934.t1